MDTLRKFRKSILLLCKVGMLLFLLGAFYYIWINAYPGYPDGPRFYRESSNYLILLLYLAILCIFLMIYNATKFGIFRLSEIIYSFGLSVVMANTFIYFPLILVARHLLSFIPILQLMIIQMAISVFLSWGINKLYFVLYPAREVLVIRPHDSASAQLIRKLQMKKDRYKVKAVISEDMPLFRIQAAIDEYASVLVCDIDPVKREKIVNYCSLKEKRIYITPKTADVMIKNANETQVFDTPLYYCKNAGLSTENAFAKRVMDILISFIGAIVLSPFLLIVALCIKLEDKGPIFFVQDRLTEGGRVFQLYKFRSMVVDAEKFCGPQLAEKDDPRITRVGRWIRKLRLDEIPQVFNILKGDMSVVGPRPERPEIAATYEKLHPEFRLRLAVKGGLTGYAQVYGKYNTSPKDKLLMDLMYIESYTLLGDIRLILMTVKILFMPESTEGIEQGSTLPISVRDIQEEEGEEKK